MAYPFFSLSKSHRVRPIDFALGNVSKRIVDSTVARLCPRGIQLYFAGPAALAVALGYRWNAMAPTQLHEFIIPERSYAPHCVALIA